MNTKFLCSLIFTWYSITTYTKDPNLSFQRIQTEKNPACILMHPTKPLAYVTNLFHKDMVQHGAISVIDTNAKKVIATILDSSFIEPYIMVINKSGSTAYVTNSAGTTVSVIDLTTNKVTAVIDGFDNPSGIVLSFNNNYAYVTNYGPTKKQLSYGKTVSLVDLKTNKIIKTIPVTDAPTSAFINPQGNLVYILCDANGEDGQGVIDVINTLTNTVVATIPGFSGPYNMVITPDGKQAYVSNFGSTKFTPFGTTISVVNLTTNTITKNITIGNQPSGLALNTQDNLLYVTIYNAELGNKKSKKNKTQRTNSGHSSRKLSQKALQTERPGYLKFINTQNNTAYDTQVSIGTTPSAIALDTHGDAYITNYLLDEITCIPFQMPTA